jgi:hypothetical protein
VTPAERNPVSNTVLTEAGSNPISLAFGGCASERQVQLLAKVLNDEIDLIVSHDLLFLLPFCYPN